jgi:hypothetical protein
MKIVNGCLGMTRAIGDILVYNMMISHIDVSRRKIGKSNNLRENLKQIW